MSRIFGIFILAAASLLFLASFAFLLMTEALRKR